MIRCVTGVVCVTGFNTLWRHGSSATAASLRNKTPRRRPQAAPATHTTTTTKTKTKTDKNKAATTEISEPSSSAAFDKDVPEFSRVYSTDPEDAFVNPFTGRLTPANSRVAKELLHIGFQRCATNPFRLSWDSAKAVRPSPAVLRPFSNSTVAWRKNLAALLTRPDAADAVAEEVQRLYGELTSAYLPPKLDAMHDPQLTGLTMTPDQENAVRCALRGYSMFIGGSAGTGKTVLLKAIHRRLSEAGLRVAMTATTGVAAVQLGGCTFHLAFGVPISSGETGRRRRWDANALRAVDVVVIDEVSLLDAELFDAFEQESRLARLQALPFGGLQVIACGDFLQLATTESLGSGPCYTSEAFRRMIAVRLVTPMRQAANDSLYKLLVQLRVGRFDADAMKQLDRPLAPDEENVTHIFPKRADAQQLNEQRLSELRSEEMFFAPQRGPLQLLGTFTTAGLVDFGAQRRPREEVVRVIAEELKRSAALDVADHNVVVMPAGTEKNMVLIRLRLPDERISSHTTTNATSAPISNISTSTPTSSSSTGTTNGHSSGSGLRDVWPAVLAAAVERLDGSLREMREDAGTSLVPPAVSIALADPATHPNAEQLTPLRLKLGCRVMINRNLSRTVSNGSVGVVEAFAPPNAELFPRRHDVPPRLAYGRLLDKCVFARLPIVRLLGGEVVQVPPVAIMLGGTPATYFYGHEVYALPLQLGYGFTVHKVQGLTLQGTVVLDCKNFFECPHLVYVACSRVRSLQQLVVRNIRSDMVIVKRSALKFSNELEDASDIKNFAPPPGCVRASWVDRPNPQLMGWND